MKKNPIQPTDAADRRRRAEKRLSEKQRSQPAVGREDTDRLVHELEVHQIELEMQNEELQQAHDMAEERLDQYTELYDFAPTGYLTLDREGTIRQVNLTGAYLLGVERSRLLKRRFSQFVANSDRRAFSDFLETVFAGKAKEWCEVTLPQDGSEPLVLRIEGTRSTDEHECCAVMLDITERVAMGMRQKLAHDVLATLNRDNDIALLIRDILHLIKETTGMEAVGIRLRDGEDFPYIEQNGLGEDFVQAENALAARTADGGICRNPDGSICLECTCGLVISGKTDSENPLCTPGGSFWTNDSLPLLELSAAEDPRLHPRNRCIHEGFRSVALIPLRSGAEVIGLLQLNDHRKGMFTLDMIQFFEGMGAGIGIAVARKRVADEIVATAKFPAENQDPVLRIAADGKLLYANPATVSQLADWHLETGQPAPTVLRDIACHSLDQGSAQSVDIDYGDRVYSFSVAPIVDAGYANLYGRDITERKQVEAALRASEARLGDILFSMADWVWETDEQGIYTYSSEHGSDLLGRTPEDIIGKTPFDFMPPDEAKRVGVIFSELVNHKAPIKDLENWNLHKNGERICLLTSGVPILDESGNLRGYRGVDKDITERKRAEEELRHSEFLLSRAQELGRIGTWTIDLMNNAIAWTDENYRIFGVPIGTPMTYEKFLSCVHPDDRDYVNREWAAHVQTNDYDVEHRALVDGNVRWVREKADITFDEAGQPISAIGFTQDITELKQAEAEREKLQAQLAQAQKMEFVGRLAGGVAHDFNNMLMGIMNYAELCRDKLEPDHPIREWLNEITVDAKRSTQLTHQLLAFARKQIIAPKVIDLNEAIASMLKLLRRLIGEDITMKFTADPDTWPVKMDPVQVAQILANLAVNARDAIGGAGSINIDTGNSTLDAAYCADHAGAVPGDYTRLTVTDSGCGMDTETLEHIFDPFFTTKGVGEGTGLGLATVYGIVKQNDGYVNVYSEPGHGTTFKIYLPRVVAAEAVQAASATAPKPPRGTETVLVVEDEKSIRITVHMFLQDLGYTVLVAEEPEQALRLAAEHPDQIDLLITDVIMPGMSGRDLANHLLELRPAIKRLFMSGFTADVIAQRGILDDGVNFLSKPFGRDALARKVREVLEA